jgi:hypothetical protein
VVISAVLVIAADALIKVASDKEPNVIRLPIRKEMLLCYLLYVGQIALAILVFKSKGQFAVYAILITVSYGILGVLCGIFLFNEKIGFYQYIGMALGLASAILIGKE